MQPLNPPTNLSRKQTGPGINWTECFFPAITRLAPSGQGQRWSSKHLTAQPFDPADSPRKLHQIFVTLS
jgi:hypothetical protein